MRYILAAIVCIVTLTAQADPGSSHAALTALLGFGSALIVQGAEIQTAKWDRRINAALDGPFKPLLALGIVAGLSKVGVAIDPQAGFNLVSAPTATLAGILAAEGVKLINKRMKPK